MSPSALLNESRGKRVCGRFQSVNSHAEQERFELSRLETVQVCYSQWRSANKFGSNSVCQRIGFIRGSKALRRYAGTASQNTETPMSGPVVNYHLVKNGRRIRCNTENHVPIVVPGLSTDSSSLTTSTSTASLPQDSEASTCRPAVTRSQSTSRKTLRDPLRSRETSQKKKSGHRSSTAKPVARYS